MVNPANFEMPEIYQVNFQSLCRLQKLFLDTSAVILWKKSESLEKFFSNSKNAIWSNLSKYQEIDLQIQTFTDEN